MTTIILNFASRFAEHVDDQPLSRFKYVHEQFKQAQKIATPVSDVAVRGIFAPGDLKSVRRRLNLLPALQSTVQANKAYDVTFIISHNTKL